MSEEERGSNTGETQRTDCGLQDVVNALNALTEEVKEVRKVYAAETTRNKKEAALAKLSKHGVRIEPKTRLF
jgi:hypothetical protein